MIYNILLSIFYIFRAYFIFIVAVFVFVPIALVTILIVYIVLGFLSLFSVKISKFFYKYSKRVSISVDQFFNAVMFGSEDVTFSGRLGYFKKNYGGKCYLVCILCFLLDYLLFDFNHCINSIEDSNKYFEKFNFNSLIYVMIYLLIFVLFLFIVYFYYSYNLPFIY